MARIRFTDNLQRHVDCPACDVGGSTVREVLRNYFKDHPDVQEYVLDEHGALRRHMAVFVDGRHVGDRRKLTDAVPETGTVDVMQALSGG